MAPARQERSSPMGMSAMAARDRVAEKEEDGMNQLVSGRKGRRSKEGDGQPVVGRGKVGGGNVNAGAGDHGRVYVVCSALRPGSLGAWEPWGLTA